MLLIAAMLAMTVFSFPCRNTTVEIINNMIGLLV